MKIESYVQHLCPARYFFFYSFEMQGNDFGALFFNYFVLFYYQDFDRNDVIEYLLEQGVDPLIKNKLGQIAVELCNKPCFDTSLRLKGKLKVTTLLS